MIETTSLGILYKLKDCIALYHPVSSISVIFRTRWTNLDSDNLLPLENYGELNRDEHVIFCSGYNVHTLF
jgi:hypothetical protein